MNDITIIILLFSSFIGIALILRCFLDKQDKKEEVSENKTIIPKEEIVSIPSMTLLSEEEELSKMITETQSTNNIEIPLGINDKEKIISINFEEVGNILIIGTTGGGKSICLDEIITTIIMTKTKDDIRLTTIDTSMVELSHFNYIPHYIKDTIISPDEIIEEIEKLKKELSNRQRNSSNIPLLVIIDDLYDVCTYDDKILSEIEYLLKEGRKEKMYFILTTDTPSKDILTTRLKEQISATIYLTLSPGSKEDFSLELPKKDIDYATSIGNAIFEYNNKKEKILIPEIKEETLEKIKNSFE